jgi:hypothetical protein
MKILHTASKSAQFDSFSTAGKTTFQNAPNQSSEIQSGQTQTVLQTTIR